MKKILSIILIITLIGSTLIGCTQAQPESPAKTPQELSDIIVSARESDINEAFPVIAGGTDIDAKYLHNPYDVPEENMTTEIDGLKQMIGISVDDCTAYAFTLSMMNVQAYSTGIFYPAEGSEDAVLESVQAYVAAKQKEFENYLPDQYDIASNAVVRVTDDGAIILVMVANAEEVADTIEAAL